MTSRAMLMCEMLPLKVTLRPLHRYIFIRTRGSRGQAFFRKSQLVLSLLFDRRLRSNFLPPLRCPLSDNPEIFVAWHLLVCISLLHISARCDSTFFLCRKLWDPRPSLATILDSSDTTRCIRCAEDQFPRVPEIQRNVIFPQIVASMHIPGHIA